MGAATSLSVDAVDADNAELVARDNTALVKRKAVLQFGFRLVHESLVDVDTFVNEAVCLVFNGGLLFFS